MKNILKNKNFIIIIALLIMVGIVWFNFYSSQKAIERAKQEINALSQASEEEVIVKAIKDANMNSTYFAEMEVEAKNKKEKHIWKSRCLKVNLDNILEDKKERENCEENLERFAVYESNL